MLSTASRSVSWRWAWSCRKVTTSGLVLMAWARPLLQWRTLSTSFWHRHVQMLHGRFPHYQHRAAAALRRARELHDAGAIPGLDTGVRGSSCRRGAPGWQWPWYLLLPQSGSLFHPHLDVVYSREAGTGSSLQPVGADRPPRGTAASTGPERRQHQEGQHFQQAHAVSYPGIRHITS